MEFIKKKNLTDKLASQRLLSGLEELKSDLGETKNKSFVFRGQPDSGFELHPKAFRLKETEEASKIFPLTSRFMECFDHDRKEAISGLVHRPFEEFTQSEWFHRICEITIFVMQYNYSIANYIQPNQEKFDEETRKLHKLNPMLYWGAEKTFQRFFYYNLSNSVGRFSRDGTILNYTMIDDNLTGFEESRPQHYGIRTAALDFTYDPYIALFFSIQDKKYIEQYKPQNVSVYAYKQIQESGNNLIIIKHGNKQVENERIIRQKGLFISAQYPCSFYFMQKRWTSVEDYIYFQHHLGNFEILKYDIPVSYYDQLKTIVDAKGYTQSPPAGSWRVEESWLEAAVTLKRCSPSHSLDERPHGCQDKH